MRARRVQINSVASKHKYKISKNTNTQNQSLEKYEDQRRTDDGVRARRVQMNSAAGKLPPKFLLMISLQTPQISTYENINTNNNKYTNKGTHIVFCNYRS